MNRRVLRSILLLSVLLILGACSSEPKSDEFTGVWTDGDRNRVEFIAPNGFLWIRESERSSRRTYIKDKKKLTKKVKSRSVRLGFYKRTENKLSVAFVSRNNSLVKQKDLEFKIDSVSPDKLTLSTEDHGWSVKKGDSKVATFELTREKTSAEMDPVVGIWKVLKVKNGHQGRIISYSGIQYDVGQHPRVFTNSLSGACYFKNRVEIDGDRVTARGVNSVGADNETVHSYTFKRTGSQLEYTYKAEKNGKPEDLVFTLDRVTEPVLLEENYRLPWTWEKK